MKYMPLLGWTFMALLSGSAGTLLPKVMITLPCNDDASSPFNAPFFAVALIFFGNMLALFFELCKCSCVCFYQSSSLKVHAAEPTAGDGEELVIPTGANYCAALLPRIFLICLPGAFNFAACFFQIAALFFISADVLAGMRGVLILCMALASWGLCLADSPQSRWKEWVCIGVTVLGAVAVGGSGVLTSGSSSGGEASDTSAAVYLGLGLCALGYVFASLQFAVEQLLLQSTPPVAAATGAKYTAEEEGDAADGLSSKVGRCFTPEAFRAPHLVSVFPYNKWRILGVEGVFGLLLSSIAIIACSAVASNSSSSSQGAGSLVIPLDDASHVFACLAQTPSILAVVFAYVVSSFAFNVCLLHLSDAVGGNFRAFVFTARGFLTWLIEISIFYLFRGEDIASRYGQPLSLYSILTALGFALLVGGGMLRLRVSSTHAPAAAAGGGLPAPLSINDDSDIKARLLPK